MPTIDSSSPFPHDFSVNFGKRAVLVVSTLLLPALGYFAYSLNHRPVERASSAKLENSLSSVGKQSSPALAANTPDNGDTRRKAARQQRPPANKVQAKPVTMIAPVQELSDSGDLPRVVYATPTRALRPMTHDLRHPTLIRQQQASSEAREKEVIYMPETSAGPGSDAASTTSPASLNGAGATFPAPVYAKWFSKYHEAHPDVTIQYQAIGSGGGIKQIQAGTVDFGATDTPMTDQQIAAASVRVLHIPTVLGAVVLTYNLPGVSLPLKFTPAAIAGIFLGEINKWNDPAIVAANPGVSLPEAEIVVVHRSDGNATSFMFTDYLSKVSDEWKTRVGRNTSVNWPRGTKRQGLRRGCGDGETDARLHRFCRTDLRFDG